MLGAAGDIGAFGALLAEVTSSGDFALDHVASGLDAVKRAEQQHYDAVILDTVLTDMEAYEACRILRRRDYKAPIFVLCAAGNDAAIILGLNVGASDCLTKPFSPRVLLARVRAHLKRFEHQERAALAIGPYVLQPARRQLLNESEQRRIVLSATQLVILTYLYHRGAEGADRREIARDVLGWRTDLRSHSVETHIWRLRQKIEANPAYPQIILTGRTGYRLSGLAGGKGSDERLRMMAALPHAMHAEFA